MRYCKKCVNPDTRPDTYIDDEDICIICRYAEKRKKNLIDWNARRKELEEIARWGKENSQCSYDCIVPVSGGKDSTRQALYVRDELGLKPLLVSMVYPPEQQVERGAYNLGNLISLGFDTISASLNPQIWKKLMRESWFRYANWCKSTELPLYAIPIHFAIAYGVPLVFLGENPAYSHGQVEGGCLGGEATKMKYSNTLAGGDADKYLTEGISRKDLYFYNYPSDQDMEKVNVRIFYLGYYIEDFNSFKNAEIAVQNGLKLRDDPIEDTGEITGTQSLDEDFYMVNQMAKYVKFGFGQVNDKVCEMIALGMIDREEGIKLIKKYDGKCAPRFIKQFCQYIDISEDEFWEIVESYRDPSIWGKDKNNEWQLKEKLW